MNISRKLLAMAGIAVIACVAYSARPRSGTVERMTMFATKPLRANIPLWQEARLRRGIARPAATAQVPIPDPAGRVSFTGNCELKCQVAAHKLFIPAMAATGYGRMTLTGFKLVGGSKYRATYAVSYRAPTATDGSGAATASFCWPWDDNFGIGCASWNVPSSWDWGAIWNWSTGQTGNGGTFNFNRQQRCASGAIAGEFGLGGVKALSTVFGFGELAKVVGPEEWVISPVAGCVVNLFWSW